MEGKLPQFNTRVKLPMTSDRLAVYDGELAMTKLQNERVWKLGHVVDVRAVGVHEK